MIFKNCISDKLLGHQTLNFRKKHNMDINSFYYDSNAHIFFLPIVILFCHYWQLKTPNFEKKVIFPERQTHHFFKMDVFNCRLRLNETTKSKKIYMSSLVIIRRDSKQYLRIIRQKIKPPSPFVWTAFFNVTIVT